MEPSAVRHVLIVLIGALLLVAAWRDFASRIIPNGIPASIAAMGLLVQVLDGPWFLLEAVIAGLVVFLILLFGHARGMIGGGDVKLIAAVACGLKLPALYPFIFITAMAGAVLACLHLLGRRWLNHTPPRKPCPKGTSLLLRVLAAERWRIARHGPLPYGVAIACGGLFTLLTGAPR